MYCKSCGKPKSSELNFCPNCGNGANVNHGATNSEKNKRKLIFIIPAIIVFLIIVSTFFDDSNMGNGRVAKMLEEKHGEKFTYVRRGFVSVGSDYKSSYWRSNEREDVTFEVLVKKDYSEISDLYTISLIKMNLRNDLKKNLGKLSSEYIVEVSTYDNWEEESIGNNLTFEDYSLIYPDLYFSYTIFFEEEPTIKDLEKIYLEALSLSSKYPSMEAFINIYLDTTYSFNEFVKEAEFQDENFGTWDSTVRDIYKNWRYYSVFGKEDNIDFALIIKNGSILKNQRDTFNMTKEEFLNGSFN